MYFSEQGSAIMFVPECSSRYVLDVCRVKADQTRHSFCIVASTTAAISGVPVHLVQIPGLWSSDACKLYILGLLNPILQPFRRDSLWCHANIY